MTDSIYIYACERVGERESRMLGMGQLCKRYKQSCVFLMEIRMHGDIAGAIEAVTASSRAEEFAPASIGFGIRFGRSCCSSVLERLCDYSAVLSA